MYHGQTTKKSSTAVNAILQKSSFYVTSPFPKGIISNLKITHICPILGKKKSSRLRVLHHSKLHWNRTAVVDKQMKHEQNSSLTVNLSTGILKFETIYHNLSTTM